MMWIAWLLAALAQDDPAALVARLSAAEPEVRAAAEAGLRALETQQIDTLSALRERTMDVEVRARLGDILRHLGRRKSGDLYAQADVPGALQALAKAEGGSAEARTAEAVEKLLALLPNRSEEFSAGGNVLTSADVDALAPKIDPLLPWIYPELIRRLGGRPELSGNASRILRHLSGRAAPALCWGLRSAPPPAQAQACLLLGELRAPSTLVLEALKAAAKAENAEVRRQAEEALRRLERFR